MNAVALSPYHLTTREAPAMAALLLAGRICTLLPTPLAGETHRAVEEALRHSPRYRRLMNNWLLLAPLFNAGVIVTLNRAEDPVAEVRVAAGRITTEETWEPLRPFARPEFFDEDEQYLDAYAADLLKGGPDPGIALPTCAGLDAFAVEQGLPVFRAGHAAARAGTRGAGADAAPVGGGSLAQQVEARLGEQLFSVGLPILKQAGARSIAGARTALKAELAILRNAVDAAILNPSAAAAQGVRRAGAGYASAFKRELGDRLNRDDEGGKRLAQAYVSLAARRMPTDATLISSLGAFSRASGEPVRAFAAERARPASAGALTTLTVTVLDVEPL